MTGDNVPPFPIGAKVRLLGCAFGEPGRVLHMEQRKVAVNWSDFDYLTQQARNRWCRPIYQH